MQAYCLLLQEFLPKEISPLLKELDSLKKCTDRTVEKLFDEACKESLTANCLKKAAGIKTRPEYVKVIFVNLSSMSRAHV